MSKSKEAPIPEPIPQGMLAQRAQGLEQRQMLELEERRPRLLKKLIFGNPQEFLRALKGLERVDGGTGKVACTATLEYISDIRALAQQRQQQPPITKIPSS